MVAVVVPIALHAIGFITIPDVQVAKERVAVGAGLSDSSRADGC